MTDTVSELRKTMFIYCLEQLADGSYLALNRRYKPVGLSTVEWVDYETFPGRFKFKRALSARQVQFLSFKGDPDPKRIYFYNDGCIPTDSDAHWKAYSDRLQRLAGYLVAH